MKPNALAQIKLTRYRVALPEIESPQINSDGFHIDDYGVN